ncbi:helix-turn-helix transcriptional regulator [Streptomyces durbertensis]|uniref:Helix-turn-helix transcriptional regulator n=1 Tax=Streptomyces durbertensis TaxID=2448886 RepID=A0ABR6EJ05_9ACTN|nr:helix-turn-helix transcriptional regulator [Streptomyces durbertensis]MBB1244935.1 helix-turn-helix transcriptional regulator [Streptomyces durbertensis]
MPIKRHRLIQRRHTVGLTQEALAERLGVDRSTIVRWESGRGGPQPWMRPRFAAALGINIEELQDLLAEATGDDTPRRQRREHALRHPSRIDLTTAAALRDDFTALASRYDHAPSTRLLAEAGQQLTEITSMASQAPAGRVQRDLRILQADASTLMGQLVWDASQRRDHATARTYYDQSVSVAQHLRDHVLEAHALLRTCYVALYGAQDPHSGLSLAHQAATSAKPVSHALTGIALLHVAEAHAMLGSSTDCEAALSQADRHLSKADSADAAAELLSPTQFGRLAGSCYLSLGQHHRARSYLEATAGQLQDRRKSRTIVLGNLTLACIRQREVDTAVAYLDQAINELEDTRGGGGMNIVFSAARELRPWRQQPDVADVHDRLLALMAAP